MIRWHSAKLPGLLLYVVSLSWCAADDGDGWSRFQVGGNRLLTGKGESVWAIANLGGRNDTRSIGRFQGNTWVNLDASPLFGRPYARGAAVDGSDGLWLGDTELVVRESGDAPLIFRKADLPRPAYAADSILLVEAMGGDAGSMWAVARIGGFHYQAEKMLVLRYDGKAWSYSDDTSMNGFFPRQLRSDGKGGVWILAEHPCGDCVRLDHLVHCDADKQCARIPSIGKGYLFDLWADMAADGPDRAWVASQAGLALWDGGRWQILDTANSSLTSNPFHSVTAKNGEAWTASASTLWHLRDGRADTLAFSDPALHPGAVKSMAVSPGGALWLSDGAFAFRYQMATTSAAARDRGFASGAALRLEAGYVNVSLNLPVPGRTELSLLDMRGRSLGALFDAPLTAGPQRIRLPWRSASPGEPCMILLRRDGMPVFSGVFSQP